METRFDTSAVAKQETSEAKQEAQAEKIEVAFDQFKEVPRHVKDRIDQVMIKQEFVAEELGTVEKIFKNNDKEKDLVAVREGMNKKERALQLQEKYQAHEASLSSKEEALKKEIETVTQEIARLERLSKQGPSTPAEAIALKREFEGEPAVGLLDKLQDKLKTFFPGSVVQDVRYGLCNYKQIGPKIEKLISRNRELIMKLFDSRGRNTEFEEAKQIAERGNKEIVSNLLNIFPDMVGIIGEEGWVDSKKLAELDLQQPVSRRLIKDLLANLPVMREMARKNKNAVEETEFGYLNFGRKEKVPLFVVTPETIDYLEEKLRRSLGEWVGDGFSRNVNNIDNQALRFLDDKTIARLGQIADQRKTLFPEEQGLPDNELYTKKLIERREKARDEAKKIQETIVFHVTPPENFEKILSDKLLSLVALKKRAENFVATSGANQTGSGQNLGHDEMIFFSRGFIQDQYATKSGDHSNDFNRYRGVATPLLGFASKEAYLMLGALRGSSGHNTELALKGGFGEPGEFDPSAFATFVPKSQEGRIKAQFNDMLKQEKVAPYQWEALNNSMIVYPDNLLTGDAAPGQAVADYVSTEIKKRKWFRTEPGGIRTNPDGTEYYQEDGASW